MLRFRTFGRPSEKSVFVRSRNFMLMVNLLYILYLVVTNCSFSVFGQSVGGEVVSIGQRENPSINLIVVEQVSRVNLLFNIVKIFAIPVRKDAFAFTFEPCQVVYDF